jgi:hypothetical protein
MPTPANSFFFREQPTRPVPSTSKPFGGLWASNVSKRHLDDLLGRSRQNYSTADEKLAQPESFPFLASVEPPLYES